MALSGNWPYVLVRVDEQTQAALVQRAERAGLPVSDVAQALLMAALGTACPTCGRSGADRGALTYETKEAPHGPDR